MHTNINWKEFLGRNDMVWDELPSNWREGAFIGNGLIGSMFWLKEDGSIHFEVSRTDYYDHRHINCHILFAENRLPNGHFKLNIDNEVPTGNLRLNLRDAEVGGELITSKSKVEMSIFTHAEDNIILIKLHKKYGEGKYKLDFCPAICASTRPSDTPKGYTPYPMQTRELIDDVNVSVQTMPDDEIYNTKGKGEGQFATAWKTISNGDTTYIYISMGFSYPGTTAISEAVENVKSATIKDFNEYRESHCNWWHKYYEKSFISVPDAKYESYYWIQMYKIASATRSNKPAVDLMGPWFHDTVWPAIWWNLNIQLAYWLVYVSNHCEFGDALINLLHDNKKNLADNCGLDRDDMYSITRATSHSLKGFVGSETGNLAYTLNNVWQQYRYTMDDTMLQEKLLPLMIGNLKYILTLTYRDVYGKIHIKETASPEYTNNVEDCSYTLSLIRWLASSIIWSNERLKISDTFDDSCRDLLENLTQYPENETGIMIGKDMTLDFSHRHWSHLFMIYPLYEYTYEDESKVELINTSLNYWLDKPELFAGYSWFGAASMYAMMEKGDEAIKCVHKFFENTNYCCANTMYMEGPMHPVIETPLFAARTLQDMLLGSYNGVIRVFPAMPEAWKDVEFHQLLAEGAFLVSAKRKGGETEFVYVKSLKGEPCRIKIRGINNLIIEGSKKFNVTNICEEVIEINLGKDDYVILKNSEDCDLSINAVESFGCTTWGKRISMKVHNL